MTWDRERLDRLTRLFATARTLPSAQWATWLAANAGADDGLRDEVLSLLQQHSSAGLSSSLAAEVVALELPDPATSVRGHRIIRELGSGGMGTVYLAEQVEPVRRTVAIKVIKRGMDSRAVLARFEDERQTLAAMTSDHIARVFDAGLTEDGRPFFTMEYVDGVPLVAFCDIRRLPLPERIRLFRQVCDGVTHAHERGVVHRDLKPGNILVSLARDEPIVKLIDFGIARAIGANDGEGAPVTREGHWLGTPEYMSPEQARSPRDVDFRSDVYSLGVILYELLTGDLPLRSLELRSGEESTLRQRIAEIEPAKPSTRVAEHDDPVAAAACRQLHPTTWSRTLRGDLDWITMKALEKDRQRRYASPAQLGADLDRHLRHQPVEAGPPSVVYRLRKFLRRRRVAVAAWSLVAVSLSSLAFAARQWRSESERGQRAPVVRERIEAGLARLSTTYAERPGETRLLGRLLGEVDDALAAATAEGIAPELAATWAAQVAAWRRDLTFLAAVDPILFGLSCGSDRARARHRQLRTASALRGYGIELDGPGGEPWRQAAVAMIRDSHVADWVLLMLSQARNASPTTPWWRIPERCRELLEECLDGPRRDLLAGDFSGRDADAASLLRALAPTLRPLDAVVLVPELRNRKLGQVADELMQRLAGQPSPMVMGARVTEAWARYQKRDVPGAVGVPSYEEMTWLITGLLSSNPDSRIGWVYRARLLASRNDPGAKAACQAALALFPDDPTTLYYLAGLEANGDENAARATLRRLLVSEPAHAQGYEMLAMLTPDAEERLAIQRRAVAADPWFGDNVLPLARALLERGRAEEASGVLVDLLTDQWRVESAFPLLAAAAEQLGDFARAQLCYRALACVRQVAAVPEHGAVLLRAGQPERARAIALAGLLTAKSAEEREPFVRVAAAASRALGAPFDADAARNAGDAPEAAWGSLPEVAVAVARHEGRWADAVAVAQVGTWPDTVAGRGERLAHACSLLTLGLDRSDADRRAEAWAEIGAIVAALEARGGTAATAFDTYLEAQLLLGIQPVRMQLERHGQTGADGPADPAAVRDVRQRLVALRNDCRGRLLARFADLPAAGR